MKKMTLLRNPVRVNDLSFDDYSDVSDSWQLRAERLVQRQEKRLRLKNI